MPEAKTVTITPVTLNADLLLLRPVPVGRGGEAEQTFNVPEQQLFLVTLENVVELPKVHEINYVDCET